MSTEEVHATPLSGKNEMTGRPDVDDDARTESSEGSNSQQQWAPEAAESEEEFVDAMEPPSSTSGVLLAFEGAVPPLSGVYEDALEATEEQVMAALESTGSECSGGGRQSTIQEEENEVSEFDNEKENAVDDEVVAVVEGIMERAAASAGELAEFDGIGSVDPVEEDSDANVDEMPTEQETVDEAVNAAVVPKPSDPKVAAEDEIAATEEALEEDTTTNKPTEVEAVDGGAAVLEVDTRAEVTAKGNADKNEIEQVASNADVEVAAEGDIESNVVDETIRDDEAEDVAIEVQEIDKADKADELVEQSTIANDIDTEDEPCLEEVVDSGKVSDDIADTSADPALEGTAIETSGADEIEPTHESTYNKPAVDGTVGGEQADAAEGLKDDNVIDSPDEDMTAGEEVSEATPGEDEVAVAGQVVIDALDPGASRDAAQAEETAVESIREAEAVNVEIQLVDSEALGLGVAEADEAAVVGVGEDATAECITEEVAEEEEEPTEDADSEQAEEPISDESIVAEVSDDAPVEPPLEEEATTQSLIESSVDEGAIGSEVKETIAQITDVLVEAVQLEQGQENSSPAEAKDAAETESCVEVEESAAGAMDETEEAVEEKRAADSVTAEPATKEAIPQSDNSDLLEVVPADAQANSVAKQHNRVEEDTAASVVKETIRTSSKSSSHGSHQSHPAMVVDLLPRLMPMSGTTTTTTIEPFVLSSESNEMTEIHLPPQRWTYEVYGFSIENRVVFYHIHKSDRRTGIRELPILKRYTDFRELQDQLWDTCSRAAADMPRIPRPHLGTIFRGYKSKKTIELRENAFRAVLRYIAQYPELHGSSIFERFITTSRATTGAGWM